VAESTALSQFLARERPGVSTISVLPRTDWDDRWDDIVVEADIKADLLSFALFCLNRRSIGSTVRLPIHGVALLAGPPGTGKTTLAHGIANEAAKLLGSTGRAEQTLFAVIDPHAFPKELLGESQRAVARLFDETLPELAGAGLPLVVLIDEIEALAVTRSLASLDTNPVDVHRATDAVLTGLDKLARAHSNTVLLATTNAIDSLDPAFLSRVDVIERFPMPGRPALAAILRGTLAELGVSVNGGAADLDELADGYATLGLDARQVRKLALRAVLRQGTEYVLSPHELSFSDLLPQLRAATASSGAATLG
jgi:SpoVK/Ycf46/Vps4 family AAA+-type ATPase